MLLEVTGSTGPCMPALEVDSSVIYFNLSESNVTVSGVSVVAPSGGSSTMSTLMITVPSGATTSLDMLYLAGSADNLTGTIADLVVRLDNPVSGCAYEVLFELDGMERALIYLLPNDGASITRLCNATSSLFTPMVNASLATDLVSVTEDSAFNPLSAQLQIDDAPTNLQAYLAVSAGSLVLDLPTGVDDLAQVSQPKKKKKKTKKKKKKKGGGGGKKKK